MFHICRIKMKTLIFAVWTCPFRFLFSVLALTELWHYMNSDSNPANSNKSKCKHETVSKVWLKIWGFWLSNSRFSSCFEMHLGWTQNEFHKLLPWIFIDLLKVKSFLKENSSTVSHQILSYSQTLSYLLYCNPLIDCLNWCLPQTSTGCIMFWKSETA